MARLLVIEDDELLTSAMSGYLRQMGHEVICPAVRPETTPKVDEDIDLVLLDLDYSDQHGLAACRDIRAESDVLILSFSASNTELDRVLALQAGADDCVASTCSAHEVAARIEALMRRARPRTVRSVDVIECGRLRVNRTSHEAFLDGEPVRLTLKEFGLLDALAARPGCVLSRRELMERVWHDPWGQASRTLDTHVNSLRAKLCASDWIVTVRGVGYRLDVPQPGGTCNLCDGTTTDVASRIA